jgi:Flp pilus assembly protein TadG
VRTRRTSYRKRPVSRQPGERGTAGVAEIVLLTPLFLLVAMFIAEVGRLQGAHTEVAYAARAAARAAAELSPATAPSAANQVAAATLASEGVACATLDVEVNTAALVPAGTVEVTVACTTGLGDLGLLRLPVSVHVTASAVEVIDTIRGSP